jgi:hypothetical protein
MTARRALMILLSSVASVAHAAQGNAVEWRGDAGLTQLTVGQSFTNARVGGAAQSQSDDVFNLQTIGLKDANQSQRKILVEQNLHEA